MTDSEQQESTEESPPDINLAEMTDDQISNLDVSSLGTSDLDNQNEKTYDSNLGFDLDQGEDDQEQDTSADDTDTGDNDTDDTGGADAVDDSTADDDQTADSTSDEQDTDSDTDTGTNDQEQAATTSDQDVGTQSDSTDATQESTEDVNYESEFNKVMAPFKAAKREIKPKSIDDARRLMQMGVDYSRKMEAMKPYQRVLKTLEKNGLLDIEKVNFLIDLDKKNPDAVKKFLKDSEIDPMDLSLEDDTNYTPTDHTVGDAEVALDNVLDQIRDTETFDRTIDEITNQWDTASKQVLMDNPGIIGVINDQIAAGIYDQIMDVVTNEKSFGRLQGLSDLEAYRTVGDAIQKRGGFKPHPNAETTSGGNTDQGHSQDSGSGAADKKAAKLRSRKRAASPTKGSASAGKPKLDIMSMSDEEIEKLDVNSL